MDFTIKIYKRLLTALQNAGYTFYTFQESFDKSKDRNVIVLRHDVDLKPKNSLLTAKIEASLGIKSVYYFRAVPESWDEAIIKEIAALGHEIGYHYESLTTCKGDVDAAYYDFCKNLEELRDLVPVSTICMHGSPRSPYDSKDIWKKYSYKELSIMGEPYLDTDFSKVFYLTDTGHRWDGFNVSVRDKIPFYQDQWIKKGLVYHSTNDIIKSINNSTLPSTLMITTHPQRWNNFGFKWVKEVVLQNVKNVVKRILLVTSLLYY